MENTAANEKADPEQVGRMEKARESGEETGVEEEEGEANRKKMKRRRYL